MNIENSFGCRSKSTALITVKEVARLLGVSVPTVNRYRKTVGFPRPIFFSAGMVRFYQREIEAWIESRRG